MGFFRIRFLFFLSIASFLQAEVVQPVFTPFTGKVLGQKVRLRPSPDLKGEEISTLMQGDLLLVKGEIGDFYEVKAPMNLSAFVYKNLVSEGKIDADRVNIRVKPSKESTVLGSLNMGYALLIRDDTSYLKWIKIAVPESCSLYVAKEFIGYAGNPSYLEEREKRKEAGLKLLQEALSLADQEEKKPFEQMQPQEAIAKLQKVIEAFSDLKPEVQQAKLCLACLQENYLEKKLSYLALASKEESVEEVFFPDIKEETSNQKEIAETSLSLEIWKEKNPFLNKTLTPKMKTWVFVEKELFDSWYAFHPQKSVEDFYLEQKVNGDTLQGVIQAYDPGMNNRPGDYVLRKNGAFAAFLYSTYYDLDTFLGKKVTILVSPRPNHHFAFPAYFVLEVK